MSAGRFSIGRNVKLMEIAWMNKGGARAGFFVTLGVLRVRFGVGGSDTVREIQNVARITQVVDWRFSSVGDSPAKGTNQLTRADSLH